MELQYLEDIEKAHSCDGARHLTARCHPEAAKFLHVEPRARGKGGVAVCFHCAECEAGMGMIAVDSWSEGMVRDGELYTDAVVFEGKLYLGNPPEPPVATLTVARRCELQAPRLPC